MTDSITKVISEMRELSDAIASAGINGFGNSVTDLADRLAALDGWRPIAEAPRDGERMLCSTPTTHTYIAVAFWDDLSDRWREWDSWEFCEPTHWRPLPDPPKDSEQKD
jgi:hypothetical protein